MKKLIVLNLIFLSLGFAANAQRFPFGVVDQEALDMKKYDKDETAHAVVIKEYGETGFIPGDFGYINILHEYHVKIKILDQEGLKYGKVEIPLYNGEILAKEGLKYGEIALYNGDMPEMAEDVNDVVGVTTYKDENGAVKTVELSSYDVNSIKKNKNHKVVKFTLPALRPGCVIEYSYRILSPLFLNLRPWSFQSEIPKVVSTYATSVPILWSYHTILRGNLKLTRTTSNKTPKCFVMGPTKADCVYSLYEIANVPAFQKEAYMGSPKNYMSALNFELSHYSTKFSFNPIQTATEWESVDKQFEGNIHFGDQLKKTDFLKSKIAPAIAGAADQLTQAKAIYKFIQKSVKWDSINSSISANIRRVLDNHNGDAGDINLTLVAALRAGGINAVPVLISTRDHGAINKQFPSMSAFDYVIAQATIDDNTYLLDATDPLLPFGILPLRDINDQGRVLASDKPALWIDLAANQNNSSTYLLNLTVQDDGKVKGTLTSRFAGYAAYEKRNAIKKYADTKQYVANFDEKLPALKITNSEINNLDSLDLPVTETFDIEVENGNADKINFNPYLVGRIAENPFKAEDRNYPVDLGRPADTKVIVNVTYPDTYVMESLPQSTGMSLPEQGGRFSVTSQSTGNSLSLTNTLSLKKAIYTADEYQQLKELYDKIIDLEKNDIVLKKK
jgi:transglutaminase-like putative cysteine protease